MKKNGRTIKEDLSLIVRGLKEFCKILPGQLLWLLANGIIASFTPYISIVLSASILNELTGRQDKKLLLLLVLVSVGLTFLLHSMGAYFEARISVGFSRLFSSHEITLTDKAYRIPYELLEKDSTRTLREQVSGNLLLSGAGMASLYWDVDAVVRSLCSAFIALILCFYFVGQMVSALHTGLLNIRAVSCITLFLSLLLAVCSYLSARTAKKRFDVSFELFEHGAKYNRYGEFYTMNYLPDEDLALDVRMFHQKNLILEESQNKCYRPFARGIAREMKALSMLDGMKLLSMGISGFAVYAIVGYLTQRGALGIGNILMVYTAVMMLLEAVSAFAAILTDLRNNNIHLLHYFAYIDLEEARDQENPGKISPSDSQKPAGGLLFEHVSFHYPESEALVLQDITLHITPGERLAIVGENGSGKTTLIKLLCRLYHPTSGRILLYGKDIWSYPYEEYIRKISTVFQDFSLFAFSIAENVAASDGYDRQKVYESLCQAGLQKKIAGLAKGMEQTIFHDYEEDGTEFSGGEAQKLAIARAIYKASHIVILDEPTAALDPFAEQEIYEHFFKNLSGETVLSISHRLSSCRLCDRVAVLDQGRLVQQGTHEELLGQTDGKYQALWKMQAQYYS